MNDTVTVLPRHNHRGLQLDDVAMDTIGQYNNLIIYLMCVIIIKLNIMHSYYHYT